MGGRPKKPVEMLIFENKSKRSKKDLQARKDLEVSLGDKTLIIPTSVKNDKIALKKWKYLVKLYQDCKYISSADVDTIEQYCLVYSQWDSLVASRSEFMAHHKKLKTKSWEVIEGLNKIDNMINKKSDLLQKLGKTIYLSATERAKGLPISKEEPEKKSPLQSAGFGNV